MAGLCQFTAAQHIS